MGVVNLERESYWFEHVRAWRGSGLSQSEYCARRALSRVNLHYWIKRESKKSRALTLVPVRGAVFEPVTGCVLRGANGWQVEFPDGASASYLGELMKHLR